VNRPLWGALILAALAAGFGGLLVVRDGTISPPWSPSKAVKASPANEAGPVLYYRDPDGKPFYAAEPKQTADGRSWRAVREGEDISFDPQPVKAASGAAGGTKRVLYYRNPMGLPDISQTPKKDSMGMDYIPVYEGEDDDGTSVKLSPGKLQRIGVTSEPVQLRALTMPIRAPGVIKLDERKISVVSMRAEGFVETVENVTSGSEVRKGQPLLRMYSPAIASAAAEYLSAFSGKAASIPGSRQRVMNFAVPPEFLTHIETKREVPLTFTWTAPRDGVVLERNVVDGMRVVPGDVLFRIADHSVVWAVVDVTERDLAAVAKGQPVKVRVRSYPDKEFNGVVSLVYPHLNPATRTVNVRVELPNTDFLLRPDMYADAEINTGDQVPVLTVPDSAVLDSGDRQAVIVDKGEGRFEPRNVRLGRRGGGYVEILDGLKGDEAVVTSANFLIDAESNLKASLKSLTGGSAAQ
jgi:membrane fusion protein, copper/silver efflux system